MITLTCLHENLATTVFEIYNIIYERNVVSFELVKICPEVRPDSHLVGSKYFCVFIQEHANYIDSVLNQKSIDIG